MTDTAFRASIFHCLADPEIVAENDAIEYFHDGLMIVRDGVVATLGEAGDLLPGLSENTRIVDLSGKLLVPGFVDCHVHFPQTDIIASYGEQLLDWLNKYAYPVEQKFSDADYATDVAEFFSDELLRNGTTTALVFATVHPFDRLDRVAGGDFRELLHHCPDRVLEPLGGWKVGRFGIGERGLDHSSGMFGIHRPLPGFAQDYRRWI